MSKGVIKIEDVQAAGYCVRGTRRWCIENGLSFRQLVDVGIPIEELEARNDVIVNDIISKKLERQNG